MGVSISSSYRRVRPALYEAPHGVRYPAVGMEDLRSTSGVQFTEDVLVRFTNAAPGKYSYASPGSAFPKKRHRWRGAVKAAYSVTMLTTSVSQHVNAALLSAPISLRRARTAVARARAWPAAGARG